MMGEREREWTRREGCKNTARKQGEKRKFLAETNETTETRHTRLVVCHTYFTTQPLNKKEGGG